MHPPPRRRFVSWLFLWCSTQRRLLPVLPIVSKSFFCDARSTTSHSENMHKGRVTLLRGWRQSVVVCVPRRCDEPDQHSQHKQTNIQQEAVVEHAAWQVDDRERNRLRAHQFSCVFFWLCVDNADQMVDRMSCWIVDLARNSCVPFRHPSIDRSIDPCIHPPTTQRAAVRRPRP